MEGAAVAQCQHCKAQLVITSTPSSEAGSSVQSSQFDDSFLRASLLLEEQLGGGSRPQQRAGPPSVGMDESFVVLPPAFDRAGAAQPSQHGGPPFHEAMQTLARVFELASDESQISQPLCTDCVAAVQQELKAQLAEALETAAAFEALGRRRRAEAAEAGGPMEAHDFASELRKAQEEARLEKEKLARVEGELAEAQAELGALQAASAQLDDVEQRYWHAANAAALAVDAAVDERDALAQRIEGAERALGTLRRTNVLADIFRIWGAGPFGTISGLRLGRTTDVPVEWEEINAAWGQAVLLLDCLARKLGLRFAHHRLEPRGSYPRVHDARGAADLFGPANKIVCPSFDRAQAGFLACLRELAGALAARGASVEEADGAGRHPFALPYPIEGDRVGGLSIKYALSRDKAWTKALKHMLVDLKYCLRGTLEVANGRDAAQVAALPREGPAG